MESKVWPVGDLDDILLDLSDFLRRENLIGEAASKHGGPDELLFQSGGPIGEDARYSMLAGPPTLRIVCDQPSRVSQPPSTQTGSAMEGEFELFQTNTNCDWQVEEWMGYTGWKPRVKVSQNTLSESLRSLNHLQPELPKNGREWVGKGGDEESNIVNELPIQPGCFAGLLTYDLVQWTEVVKLKNLPEVGALLGVLFRVDRWVIHDRLNGTLHLSSLRKDGWFDQFCQLIDKFFTDGEKATFQLEKGGFSSTITDKKHEGIVESVISSISDGQFYQVNYGRIWSGELRQPWAVFRRLQASNPAPYAGWLFVPDRDYVLATVSPELLLSYQGGILSTRPIKGTRPRARTRARDEAMKRELAASEKEIAEHMMLVDLERNDLSKVCTPGSVKWHDWRIESHPTVHHLVSDVRGELASDRDGWDALQALFPGGSITGCPKSSTIAAIDELEGVARRAWTGSLGIQDPRTGFACWNILIRSLEAEQKETGVWNCKVQAGGGLVFNSSPRGEVEEAKWKAQALLDAAWGYSASEVPKGEMTTEPVPVVSDMVAALTQTLDDHPRICIAPADPILWQDGDADLVATEDGGRRLLFIDNLDSFSWNIVHVSAQLGIEVVVANGRNHQTDLTTTDLISAIKPTHIILGPGPGWPRNSSLTQDFSNLAINGQLKNRDDEIIPLLGICLGHQALGEAAGWGLSRSQGGAVHGMTTEISLEESPIFQRLESLELMMRYHSLSLTKTNDNLEVIATLGGEQSTVMGIVHPEYPVWGVQFHPESCGSPKGWMILENFFNNSMSVDGQSVEVPLASREG